MKILLRHASEMVYMRQESTEIIIFEQKQTNRLLSKTF